MNDHFATAMGRALEQTRAGNPAEAMRLIQAVLNGPETAMSVSDADTAQPAPRPRRPLGQVIDSLVKGKAMHGLGLEKARFDQPLSIPDGALYETHRHACAFGERDVRVFLPSPRGEPVGGLILMLHGCTQSADDFAAGTRMNLAAEEHNLIIAYPEQTRRANQMGCWNWFRGEDQRRGGGEAALLADLASSLASQHGVPDDRVFAAGLSAGGAMAAILGDTHPEVFAAVGVHSGLAPGSATDVASAYAAMQGHGAAQRAKRSFAVRSIVFHGSADTTVAKSNGDAVVAAALGGFAADQIEDGSVAGAAVVMHRDRSGTTLVEQWTLPGVGHAWSGGSPEGSYTHPSGPDASAEMVRFFLSVAEDRSKSPASPASRT